MGARGDSKAGQKGQRRIRKIFTPEEDAQLVGIMKDQAFQSWDRVAVQLPDRTARQCRDRWMNYLAPTVRREPWSIEEDQMLIEKINEMGTHWSGIANFFIGRTDNHVKNRWYSFLKSRVGVDAAGKYTLAQDEGSKGAEYMKVPGTVDPVLGPDLSQGELDFWDARLLDCSKEPHQHIFSGPPNEIREVREDCLTNL
jgi:hypothetical protein